MEDIINVFGQFGFSVAAYIAMFWYMVNQTKIHREETAELSKVIQDNTLMVAQLHTLIDERLPK